MTLVNHLIRAIAFNIILPILKNGFFYIVVEYMDGQNLNDIILEYKNKKKYMEEKTIWELLIQCLSGLLYLHKKKKIVHRDIKPDNLLLDKNFNLKISDFGVSAIDDILVDDTVKFHNTRIGPRLFAAPEVIEGKKYDFKSDIYMLGLTFFLLSSQKSYITRNKEGNNFYEAFISSKLLKNIIFILYGIDKDESFWRNIIQLFQNIILNLLQGMLEKEEMYMQYHIIHYILKMLKKVEL